jgi:hypothetical protein
LYQSLISTCRYLRVTFPEIAWRYAFCRSQEEFIIYLDLHRRFSGEHLELHVDAQFFTPVAYQLSSAQCALESTHTRASLRLQMFVHSLELWDIPMDSKLFHGAPIISIDRIRGSGQEYEVYTWILTQHFPESTELILTDANTMDFGIHSPRAAPSITRLSITFSSVVNEWGSTTYAFNLLFPRLKQLSLFGEPLYLPEHLRQLPPSLEELILKVDTSICRQPLGRGIQYSGLVHALNRGFRLGEAGGPPPRITLLTGPEKPRGWPDALAAAKRRGIVLKRKIV